MAIHTAAIDWSGNGEGAVVQRDRVRRAAAAARRRAHRRACAAGAGGESGTAGWGTTSSAAGPGRAKPSAETISTVLLSAAREHWAGHPDAGTRIALIVADRCADQPELVAAAAWCAVLPLVTGAWERGWSPDDLHHIARRRLDATGVGYLVDAIAEESQRYAEATMAPRWREDLRQIGAVVWWKPGQPGGHLLQWARRQATDVAATLTTVIEVLAMLLALPVLPRIVPPPGSAIVTSTPRRGVDHKMLSRVRALLAKAESTTFPEEAEALSAKAQELMSRYSLERIVVESTVGVDGAADPYPAAARRLWLDNPYVAAKAMLVGAVAEANRCRTVLSEKLGFTTVLGDEVDLEIVELLSTSLLVQATRAMVSAGSQFTRSGRSRTRSYRQSFLLAYATRIGERLSAARDVSTAAVAEAARLLPVLAARAQVVDELFESMFPQSVSRSFSVGNAAGWHAGRAAADLAVLDTRRAVASGGR
ncbi:MAG TPA: DUF2786 domain-containing protein [Pseudonocardiaceae bacterium]|nr:DUF2786 domain-containing protein [Pseudonocardiaceae bacterium]